MARNTYVVVLILAVFAALVSGVNIGRRLSPAAIPQAMTPTPTPATTPTPAPTTLQLMESKECGFSIMYPSTLTLAGSSSTSAFLVDNKEASQSVALACQEDIPRPPLPADRIETRIIRNEARTASVSARLYHDASPKDGTRIDELIFRHPKTGIDVFIAGFGETFNQVIQTIKLLP